MADGINKEIVMKKETTWGTKPSAGSAQSYARVTGNFQGEKNTFQSGLIKTSQQLADQRHGTRRATGSLAGELMCGQYSQLMAACLRKDFAAISATTGSVTTIAVAATSPTFTRSTGSFITDGFKVGMIIECNNLTATADRGKYVVVDVAALTMDVYKLDLSGVAFTPQVSGTAMTIAALGKNSYTPQTGHTNDSFSVEEYHNDITLSSITLGQQVNSMSISSKPDGMVTLNFDFLGKDFEVTSGTRYFTSPTASPDEGTMSGAAGVAFLNGSKSCRVTGFDLTVNNNIVQESVIACSGIGAKSRGKVMATGSMTLILDDGVYQDMFSNEDEMTFSYSFVAADGEVLSLFAPRLKVGSVTKDDGEKVIILTVPFDILEYNGTATNIIKTSLLIQDTTL